MSDGSSVSFFYTEEPSADWKGKLAALRADGIRSVSVSIPWGAHEATRGIRDFSKASRLRLEKLLKLCQEVGLTVDVQIGFPSSKDSLPAWTFALNGPTALIPSQLWRAEAGGFSLVRIPSIHNPDLKSAFLEFVAEVFSLLSLYQLSEGAVRSIKLDLGYFEADLDAAEVPDYAEFLQTSYLSADALNKRYQTTFKDFASATSKQGTRALFNKRPWLAALDYKACRRALLKTVADDIDVVAASNGLGSIMSLSNFVQTREISFQKQAFAFDPTLLGCDDENYPSLLSPGGFVHEQPVNAFRLWRFFNHHCRKAQSSLYLLRDTDVMHPDASGLLTVVAGKYLKSSLVEMIETWVSAGGKAFFPFGFPQYQEKMQRLAWDTRPKIKTYDGKFAKIVFNSGAIWASEPAFQPDNRLWSRLSEAQSHFAEILLS